MSPMMNFAICFLAVAVVMVAGNPGYGYKPMAPSYSAPAYQARSYSPPAYRAPAYSAPAYKTPAYMAPAPSYYKKSSY